MPQKTQLKRLKVMQGPNVFLKFLLICVQFKLEFSNNIDGLFTHSGIGINGQGKGILL